MKPRYEKTLGGMHPRVDPPQWGSSPNIRLSVRTLRGRTITLDVKPSDTIRMLKAQLRDREGVFIEDQRLVLAGKALHDHNRVSDYNICSGAMITLRSTDGVKEQHPNWSEKKVGHRNAMPFHDTSRRIDRLGIYSATT